jgi:hypothetical protein
MVRSSQAFETRWAWPALEHIVDVELSGGPPRPIQVGEICTALDAEQPGDREMVKRALRYLGEKQLIDVAIASGDGDPNYSMMVRGPTARGIDRVSEWRSTLRPTDEQVLKTMAQLEASQPGHRSSTEEVTTSLAHSPDRRAVYAESISRLVSAGLLEGHDASNQSSAYPEYVDLRLTLLGTDRLEQEPEVPPAATVVNIYGGSTVGQVNFGQVIGSIQTSMEVVSGPRADDFKGAMEELLAAIQSDEGLTGSAKADALEQLEYLAEAASEPVAKRRASVLDAVLARVPLVLAAGEASAKAWNTFGPEVTRFLGG